SKGDLSRPFTDHGHPNGHDQYRAILPAEKSWRDRAAFLGGFYRDGRPGKNVDPTRLQKGKTRGRKRPLYRQETSRGPAATQHHEFKLPRAGGLRTESPAWREGQKNQSHRNCATSDRNQNAGRDTENC